MDQQLEDACRKIIALDRQSKAAGTPEEAAAFAAKAQKMLIEYNLNLEDIDEDAVTSGRVDEEFEAGRWDYQERLWSTVAHLNFCLHEVVRVIKPGASARGVRYKFKHRLVGRRVNVVATKALAGYLEQAIDRAMLDRKKASLRQPDAKTETSFREGCADVIIDKLYEQREEVLSDEDVAMRKERDEALAEAASDTKITISVFIDKEQDANIDLKYGKGTAARWAANEAARAEYERQQEDAYVQWAVANPKEARRKEEKLKARKAAEERRANNRYWRKHDMMAFREGMKAGAKIGLDPQLDAGKGSKVTAS